MTSNKISGPSPSEPGKDIREQIPQHRRVEKVKKVSKISEVENEQTRKKFQSFMQDEEDQPTTRAPSPFETKFYAAPNKPLLGSTAAQNPPPELADVETAAIPSPAYSPPPSVEESPPEQSSQNSALPQSDTFWKNTDSPPDQPRQNLQYEDKTQASLKSSQKSKETNKIEEYKKRMLVSEDQKDIEMGLQQKSQEKEIKNKELPLSTSLKKEKSNTPPVTQKGNISVPFTPTQSAETRTTQKNKDLPKNLPTTTPSTEQQMPALADVKEFAVSQLRVGDQDKEDSEQGQGKKAHPLEIESAGASSLPSQIIPLAQAATTEASSYLSSQTIPLFFQMVGTIYVMTSQPGVSLTEIVLNSPAFANSKFFGSTISIEKYATAPDSLNIRLTGTDEAVRTFNQNISNLYAAFQNGNFAFKIGRISAEYTVEKPMFHRKGKKESSSGGEFQDRR